MSSVSYFGYTSYTTQYMAYHQEPKEENTEMCYSYMYSQSQTVGLCFPDDDLDDCSLLPALKLNGHKLLFMLGKNQQPAIYYNRELITSLPELICKISLPAQLDQALLNKISTIANYLVYGKEFEYIDNSARMEGEKLIFAVKKGEEDYEVKIPSLKKNCTIDYRLKV